MYRRNIPSVLLTAAVLGTILTGCTDPGLTYTSEYARIKNECGAGWLTEGNLDVTAQEGVVYRFDPEIPEKERAAYIKNHQKILARLPEDAPSPAGLELYILPETDSHSTDGTVYTEITVQKNTEQILLTLRALYGEYANYGWLYALAADTAEELHWPTDSLTGVDAEVFRKDPDLLNLVYPCFTEPYADAEQTKACMALARHLLESAGTGFTGEGAFLQAVRDYAAANSIEFFPTGLRFSHGTSDCPLKIRTAYLEIYLDSDYPGSCTLSEESMAADPMFALTPMLAFLETNDIQITGIREKFGHTAEDILPVYIRPVEKKFSETGKNYGGMYYPNGKYAEAASVYTMIHEYVHYLDDCTGTGDDSWCGEVLAVYYQQDMTFLSRCVSAEYGADITIEWLTERIGAPYDSVEDEILFQHIMTANEENPRFSLIQLYNGRLSFGDYFVNTYGEQNFIRCMLQPEETESRTGKTMDGIIDDWCTWLEQYKRS